MKIIIRDLHLCYLRNKNDINNYDLNNIIKINIVF